MFIGASMAAVAESPNAAVQKSIDYAEGNGVVKDWGHAHVMLRRDCRMPMQVISIG